MGGGELASPGKTVFKILILILFQARQWGARLEEDWHRRTFDSPNRPIRSKPTDSFSSSLVALTAELDSLTGWGEDLGLGTQVEPVVERMRGILRKLARNNEMNRSLPDDVELSVSDNQNRIISASKWEDVPEEVGVQSWLEEPPTVSVSEWGRGAKGVTIFSSADSPSTKPEETTFSFEVNSSQAVDDLPDRGEGYYREEVSSDFSDVETPRSYSGVEHAGFSEAEEEASKINPYKFTMADAILHLPSNYRDPEEGGQVDEKNGDSFTFYNPDEDFYDLSALASSENGQTKESSHESSVGARRQGTEDDPPVDPDNGKDDVESRTGKGVENAGDDAGTENDEEKGVGGDKMLIYRAWLGAD